MLTKLQIIFLFYRTFLLPTLLVNAILVLLGNPFVLSVSLKLSLAAFIALWYKNSHLKPKLVFYNNLAVSNLELFGISFLMDILLLALTYLILGLIL